MFTRLVNICQTQMPQWWDKRCFLQTSPRWRHFVKPVVVKIGSNLPADHIRANVRMMLLFRTIDNVQTEKASTGISSQPQQFAKWFNSRSFVKVKVIQKGQSSLVNTLKKEHLGSSRTACSTTSSESLWYIYRVLYYQLLYTGRMCP